MTTCGNCGLPLHPNEVRRHFGFRTGHSEARCIELLKAEVLAERERCRKIANGCACQDANGRDECGCAWIEERIRSGE